MNETDSKKIPSSGRKAARALFHYGAFHVVLPYGLEYLFCLAATMIANSTLFHGRLDSPVAAVGVLVAGVLGRYFLKPRPVPQQPVMTLPLTMPTVSPTELAEFGKALGLFDRQDGAAAAATDNLSGPYL